VLNNKPKSMNIKLFNVALGIVLTATTLSASAQKSYTEGTMGIHTNVRGQDVDAKSYFRGDSTAFTFTMGPASIKLLSDYKASFFAVLVDVPLASIKKAGIATPAEYEDMMSGMPKLTFAPTTETKQISGFNCTKVVATDSKTSKKYDIWITKDVSIPDNAIAKYYAGIGGFPVQYTSFSQGQEVSVTVTSVSGDKAPAGTFVIAPDFQKVTMEDLNSGQ
jgi:hypothetical protein